MKTLLILLVLAIFCMHSTSAQSDWTGSGTILDPIGGDLAYQGPPRYTSYNNYYRGYSPYYNYGFFG
ncbi:unnamed protein product [Bursaphelenchus xylophilus]|uniref:(pine wood nematode) hypothetical protein n=1 Tax=Bursaphelenchus xylophilus TaxID=6326 RepID=A0A1I7RW90_BURXY|nr:unnamed protein product [Bursaphelenchus xylophilus]CAG9095292.1 unnamed protein product [Bursaphelenchus xylophilus]